MADQRGSALAPVTTVGGADGLYCFQGGNPKQMTVDQVREYLRKVIPGNSGTANQNGPGTQTLQVLTSNASSNSTTTIATVMTTSNLPAGTYKYRYDIIVQSAATTTGHKFSVDYSGTVTKHVNSLFALTDGTTAINQSVDNTTEASATIVGHYSARTDNATLGPTTAVDTANADMRYWIEGTLVVSTGGNLLLGHASEVAAASTVQLGTTLVLERFA